jgi:hypothetical protein
MEKLNTKLHYQTIKLEKTTHKIILESFDNKNFELTIMDDITLKTIYSNMFNNISNDKELNDNVYKILDDFYKKD